MKQRAGLMTLLVALFGVQAPLCAITCAADSPPVVEVAKPAGAMPCHESGEPSPEPPLPDSGCHCSLDLAWVSERPAAPGPVSAPVPIAPQNLVVAWAPRAEPVPIRAERIPPRDVLLLKSTRIV